MVVISYVISQLSVIHWKVKFHGTYTIKAEHMKQCAIKYILKTFPPRGAKLPRFSISPHSASSSVLEIFASSYRYCLFYRYPDADHLVRCPHCARKPRTECPNNSQRRRFSSPIELHYGDLWFSFVHGLTSPILWFNFLRAEGVDTSLALQLTY